MRCDYANCHEVPELKVSNMKATKGGLAPLFVCWRHASAWMIDAYRKGEELYRPAQSFIPARTIRVTLIGEAEMSERYS